MGNKVKFVPATFKPIGEDVNVNVPTGETKKGFLGGVKEVTTKETQWKKTGTSDREINGHQLEVDMQEAIDKLNEDGYDVVSVSPVTSGNYGSKHDYNSGSGWGYSYTEGMMIVAKCSIPTIK